MNKSRVQQQLLMNIAKNNESGCWEWRGQISNSGYGRLKIKADDGEIRMLSAQQVSYEVFIGPLAQGQLVSQLCNNRLCINPEHLEALDPLEQQPA